MCNNKMNGCKREYFHQCALAKKFLYTDKDMNKNTTNVQKQVEPIIISDNDNGQVMEIDNPEIEKETNHINETKPGSNAIIL